MNFVTIFMTFTPAEADLIRCRLEAAGLQARISNEIPSLTLDGYALAAGGIRVDVPEEQAAEARALIEAPAIGTDEQP